MRMTRKKRCNIDYVNRKKQNRETHKNEKIGMDEIEKNIIR